VKTDRGAVTHLLLQARAGDHDAFNRLVPLVYEELRGMAARMLRAERAGHTLQPTALVHEAYLRLIDQRAGWHDRAHFFAIAARTMRRILADYARARQSFKRGGDTPRVSLDQSIDPAGSTLAIDKVLVVDEALKDLELLDPLDAQIVELRCFGGLTVEEAAEALKVSPVRVKREWTAAKAWLYHRLAGDLVDAR
jgi:RNA polymerase sigma factor (TIGR02999 family)